jgi:hypothetical protein
MQIPMERLLNDAEVDEALRMTALMFGLPQATVHTLLRIGLPTMAALAATNPELRKRMYAASQAPMPELAHDFYSRMLGDVAIRQATIDDYRATYGGMLDTLHRQAARQVNLTDGQAREVFAAALPVVNRTLARMNLGGTEQGFLRQLQQLSAEPGPAAMP